MSTYIRFGRGNETEALILNDEMVKLITDTLRGITLSGEMATAGLPERSEKGHEQADTIHRLVTLLEAKKD